MANYFFDSSALVKCYVAEAGSVWVRKLLTGPPRTRPFVAEVTRVEVISAFLRRHPPPLPAQAALAVTQFVHDCRRRRLRFIAVNRGLVVRAIEMAMRYRLRAYDSMQLAAAHAALNRSQVLGLSAPVFVSADNELNAAATGEGFTVENPNAHP